VITAVRAGLAATLHDDVEHVVEAGSVILAVGSTSKVPEMPGLSEVPYWTNREATSPREPAG